MMKAICLIAVVIGNCSCEDFLTRDHPTEVLMTSFGKR